jgi:hypothetical protein
LAAKLIFKINFGPERKKLRNPDSNVKEALCLRASEGVDERHRESNHMWRGSVFSKRFFIK